MAKPTLRDLIRKVKRKESAPLAPELEKFFLGGPDWDHEKVRKKGWHPSSICNGICPRLEVFADQRPELFPEGSPPAPSLMRIFFLGHSIHDMYQNKVFGPMGILYGHWEAPDKSEIRIGTMPGPGWRYHEPAVHDPEYGIVGHSDGILLLPDGPALLECKSINDRGWSYLMEPKGNHSKQAQLYMSCQFEDPALDMETPKRTVFLYVNKDKSTEKEFWQDFDPKITDPIRAQIKEVEQSLAKKVLPAMLNECTRSNSARRRECPVGIGCQSIGRGGVNAFHDMLEVDNA